MKILFSSNAPWCPSGYGVQSKLLVEYLKKHNFEIVFLTNYGLLGSYLEHDGVLYLPDDSGNWGNSSIRFHCDIQKPDLVLSLMDWFVYDTDQWNQIGCPWFNWTPIDLNINPKYDRLQKYINNSFGIITMSEFGSKQLRKAGREPSAMIYHALDANEFKILPKDECKKIIGFKKDSFVIGMNMANKDASENRKAFDQQFKAVKKFIDKHSELNIILYLNTEPSEKYNGHNLLQLLRDNDFNLDNVIFTNPAKLNTYPMSFSDMAILYNSFDILMNASSGEGFGVPIIEAQACGIPVLTHDVTSMSELTFYGYSVKSDKKTKISVNDYGHRYLPNINDMVKGLESILNVIDSVKAKEVSEMVRSNFDINKIGLQWLSLIKQIG